MRVTNQLGLPGAIYDSVVPRQTQEERRSRADISVTELIGPPRIKQLRDVYGDRITIDVIDRFFALWGSGFHEFISKSTTAHTEVQLFSQWTGTNRTWSVSGTLDLIENHKLYDYKTVRAGAVQGPIKPEWEAQLNCYRRLARENGLEIAEMFILAAIRDYTPVERYRDPTYPVGPVKKIPIRIWSEDSLDAYISYRLTQHEEGFPLCTHEERWAKPNEYALMKAGGKRATGLYPSIKEATEQMNLRKQALKSAGKPYDVYDIQERKAESIRCKYYCDVWEFCEFGRIERLGTDDPP